MSNDKRHYDNYTTEQLLDQLVHNHETAEGIIEAREKTIKKLERELQEARELLCTLGATVKEYQDQLMAAEGQYVSLSYERPLTREEKYSREMLGFKFEKVCHVMKKALEYKAKCSDPMSLWGLAGKGELNEEAGDE
jgi:predicted RNase H-like nuclease (RuvC/YqgF family)